MDLKTVKTLAYRILRTSGLWVVPVQFKDDITSWTDGKMITIADKHRKNDAEFLYTFIHEFLHMILLHPRRMQTIRLDNRYRIIYNIAADAVIDSIVNSLPKDLVPKWIDKIQQHATMDSKVADILNKEVDEIRSMGTETLYRELKKHYEKRRDQVWKQLKKLLTSGELDLKPCQNPEVGPGNIFDELAVHEFFADRAELKKHLKSKGKIPGSLAEELDIIDGAKLDLRRHLKHLAKGYAKGFDDVSFLRYSQKDLLGLTNVKLPSWISRKARVLVSVDTSGSVSMEEYRDYISILLQNARFFHLDFIEVDADIQTVVENIDPDFDFSQLHSVVKKRKGFGGTSIQPVIDWVTSKRKRYDAWFHFSDMYVDIPGSKPPTVKSVFFVTEYNSYTRNLELPWGKLLYY